MKVFPVDRIEDEGRPRSVLCQMFTKDGDNCESRAVVKLYVECCDTIANMCKRHQNSAIEAIPDCQAKQASEEGTS